MKWLCVLLAIGSWVGGAFLADAKMAVPVIIFLSALGWFFIMIAIGGKKGLPFGIAIFVFTGCIIIFWWGISTFAHKERNIIYILPLASLVVLVIPVMVGKKSMENCDEREGKKRS